MPAATATSRTSLLRILGIGFSLAVIFGNTVGTGILRLPGAVAAHLGSFWPIVFVWIAGGLYSLLGANSFSETATALPQAGGFYVYSKRAFGLAPGFLIGWTDWLTNCSAVAYTSIVAAEYTCSLIPSLARYQTLLAVALLLFFATIQWFGLRLSSSIQQIASGVTGLVFIILVAACFLHPAPAASPHVIQPLFHRSGLFALLASTVIAIRYVIVAYDGWYSALYFTEEDTNVTTNLPRATFGGVLIITTLYLLINLAFLHVLSIPVLSASRLPAADAAQLVFHSWSGTFVTVLSLLTLLSCLSAILLVAPRILLAIGRDGLFTSRALQVSARGTPRAALLISTLAILIIILSGKFEQIVDVFAVFVIVLYSSNYVSLIVLRLRERGLPRPFRAWGYPFATLIVLLGSLTFLTVNIHDDPATALRALASLLLAIPVYLYILWRRKTGRFTPIPPE